MSTKHMFESEQRFSKESIEGVPKRHYKYVDNSNYPEVETVFECDALNIEEADEQYKEATGKDVRKQPAIGCQISKP